MIESSKQAMETAAFEKQFDSTIKEFIVMTKNCIYSSRESSDSIMWRAELRSFALIDTSSDKLYSKECTLTWLITKEQCYSERDIFELGFEKIHRIKARESIENGLRRLLVCDVIERNCTEERLEAVFREYNTPVEISASGCKKLLLNKITCTFEGKCTVGKYKFELCLDVECDDENYSQTLKLWEEIYNSLPCREKEAREFAAKKLITTANDWNNGLSGTVISQIKDKLKQNSVLTEEQFAKKIKLICVNISADGCFSFIYNDKGIFSGHEISVDGNINEGFTDAEI